MHPLLTIFLKLTGALAVAIALFMLLTFLFGAIFKIVVIAAVLAALVLGGLYLYNVIARRTQLPTIR
jgi:hypothetical protein